MALRKIRAVMIITGLFIGFITVTHFRSVPHTSFDDNNTDERAYIIETLLNEQSLLKSRISALRDEINKKQDELKNIGEQENVEYLEKLKADVGLKEVAGGGIEIIFDDSPNVIRETLDVNNNSLVHAADLRDIVNVLRISKAKGIVINDQRIVASSTISCVGSSILINGTHTSPPFKIQAVTDLEVAKNSLVNNDYLDKLRERINKYSLVFEVYSKDEMLLPVYNGNSSLKYML